MPAIKSIQINPALLNISSSKSQTRKNRKRRERKKKPKPHIKPNTLKKALLRRIKEHSSKEKKLSGGENNKDSSGDNDFNSDFTKHLEYLSNLSVQHRHNKKKRNKTLKTHSNTSPDIHTDIPKELQDPIITSKSTSIINNNEPIIKLNPKPTINNNIDIKPDIKPDIKSDMTVPSNIKINTSTPSTNTDSYPIKKDPPYSCLKGGNKPTYREWKRLTQKNSESLSNSSSDSDKPTVKLNELRERINSNSNKTVQKPKRTYKKRTIRRKYKFGKNNNKISVLVKNNKTRKLVQREVELLRVAPIREVKEYLKKHYLYKSGSNAPNDVLRKTYMDAHLSGEINNKSTENLLHNFVNN